MDLKADNDNLNINNSQMKSSLHYSIGNPDFNKSSINQQKSLLYYMQSKGDTEKFIHSHDSYLSTAPFYITSLQR